MVGLSTRVGKDCICTCVVCMHQAQSAYPCQDHLLVMHPGQ